MSQHRASLTLTTDGEVHGIDPEYDALLRVLRYLSVSPQVEEAALEGKRIFFFNKKPLQFICVYYRAVKSIQIVFPLKLFHNDKPNVTNQTDLNTNTIEASGS